MIISSPTFLEDTGIPSLYTCDGSDVSPPLNISEVPQNTQSLVLIMDDPDAPGGNFTHWLLWNIDPKINTILESTIPQGAVRGANSNGNLGYNGPCPPSGVHRYYFKVYALDKSLDLPSGSTRKELESAMEGHIIDQSQLVGLYGDNRADQ